MPKIAAVEDDAIDPIWVLSGVGRRQRPRAGETEQVKPRHAEVLDEVGEVGKLRGEREPVAGAVAQAHPNAIVADHPKQRGEPPEEVPIRGVLGVLFQVAHPPRGQQDDGSFALIGECDALPRSALEKADLSHARAFYVRRDRRRDSVGARVGEPIRPRVSLHPSRGLRSGDPALRSAWGSSFPRSGAGTIAGTN